MILGALLLSSLRLVSCLHAGIFSDKPRCYINRNYSSKLFLNLSEGIIIGFHVLSHWSIVEEASGDTSNMNTIPSETSLATRVQYFCLRFPHCQVCHRYFANIFAYFCNIFAKDFPIVRCVTDISPPHHQGNRAYIISWGRCHAYTRPSRSDHHR